MSTITYRPDYVKMLFNLPRGLFSTYYQRITALSHERKFHGDWLSSHKVTALPSQDADAELTVVEIWGEWAGLARDFPAAWGHYLRRYDCRAIVWDADREAVLTVGQRLQRSDVGLNVEVFNSRPASKRLGRDRGGVGFRVGSRKSDLCVVCYKRGHEPVAQEVRLQGHILRNAVDLAEGSSADKSQTVSFWQSLTERAAFIGQRRLARVLERSGIGTYWPTFRKESRDEWDQLQTSFAAPLTDGDTTQYPWEELSDDRPM